MCNLNYIPGKTHGYNRAWLYTLGWKLLRILCPNPPADPLRGKTSESEQRVRGQLQLNHNRKYSNWGHMSMGLQPNMFSSDHIHFNDTSHIYCVPFGICNYTSISIRGQYFLKLYSQTTWKVKLKMLVKPITYYGPQSSISACWKPICPQHQSNWPAVPHRWSSASVASAGSHLMQPLQHQAMITWETKYT